MLFGEGRVREGDGEGDRDAGREASCLVLLTKSGGMFKAKVIFAV